MNYIQQWFQPGQVLNASDLNTLVTAVNEAIEYAEAANKLSDEQLGNLKAALNAILALQAELMIDTDDTGTQLLFTASEINTKNAPDGAVLTSNGQGRAVWRMLNDSGQSILPAVTERDNGKFLQVVDGHWALSDMPQAEEK